MQRIQCEGPISSRFRDYRVDEEKVNREERALIFREEHHDSDSCGAKLQQQFNCSEYDCLDRVAGELLCVSNLRSWRLAAFLSILHAGYVNYLDFFYCGTGGNGGLQFLVFVLFLVWALFLLHVVETTTNE